MKRIKLSQILDIPNPLDWQHKETVVSGWIRTVRAQKSFAFIEINDGSSFANLQVIADPSLLQNYPELIEQLHTGVSLRVEGKLEMSPGKNQSLELKATSIQIYGACNPAKYPLQKKRHSFEYLRTLAHLRPRTNTQGAVLRVRNALSFATHNYFQQQGFLYLHTPIITGSDCEGGGEMFRVTTLEDLNLDPSLDFFGKKTYLTVSGQLEAEIAACALSDVYTFGPTFRAENSNTSRHIAEFWMIEPEMAFADLSDGLRSAEEYFKYCINYALKTCPRDLEFFDRFIEKGLLERLEKTLKEPFAQISYTEAIDQLKKAPNTFTFPISWGGDLQSEHERYLAEEVFQKPVFVTDYPSDLKAFYMRENEDGKTTAAFDLLAPKIGEIIGGSQREERLDRLEKKLLSRNLPKEEYWWYLELREFGSVPHTGYGLGLERLILFTTGMENIRDVIPFPRTPGHAEF